MALLLVSALLSQTSSFQTSLETIWFGGKGGYIQSEVEIDVESEPVIAVWDSAEVVAPWGPCEQGRGSEDTSFPTPASARELPCLWLKVRFLLLLAETEIWKDGDLGLR